MSFTSLLPSTTGTKQIIDPASVSFDTILEDLYADLATRPAGQQWTSRFRGGVGTTLMEWLAAVTEDLKVASLLGSRESSLQTARARSSIIRLATDLGYVVNRQTASRMRIALNVTVPIVIDPLVRFGTVNGNDVFPLTQQTLSAGQDSIDVVYATRATSAPKQIAVQESFNGLEWTAEELGVESIDFIDQDINNFEVWVDGVRQTITYFPENIGVDATDETLLVKNLGDKIEIVAGFIGIPAGVDVFVRYLQVTGVEATTTGFAIDAAYQGVVSESFNTDPNAGPVTSALQNFTDSDTNKKIATLAPGFHFSQRKAVTKDDYGVIVNSLPGVKSAIWHSGTCVNSSGGCQGFRNTEIACGDLTWIPSIADPVAACFGAPIAVLFENQDALNLDAANGGNLLELAKQGIIEAMDEFKFEGSHVEIIDAVELPLIANLQIDIAEGADTVAITQAAQAQADQLSGEIGSTWIPAQLVQSLTCIEGVVHVYIGEDPTPGINKANRELKACTNEFYSVTVNVDYRTLDEVFFSRYGA